MAEVLRGDYGNGLPHLDRGNAIVFVDTSSVHRLRVHYCQCLNAKCADRQFVAMGFLPASVILAQDSLEGIQHPLSFGTGMYHLGASLCHLIGVRIATGNSCGVNTYGDK